MFLQFKTKEEFIQWARKNLLTPQGATNLLGINRQNLNRAVKNGKLKPVIKEERITLFLREDLLDRQEELVELRMKYRREVIVNGFKVRAYEFLPGKWEYHIFSAHNVPAAARSSQEEFKSMEEALQAGIEEIKRTNQRGDAL